MAIQIVAHGPEHKAAVLAFNERMRAAGSPWGFYVDAVPTWIPRVRPDQSSWREYWLVLEDGGTVRGGYALKPQRWQIGGVEQLVADWQGPFTEGAVDPTYAALGLRIVRDMTKKYPRLFSWGHGAIDAPMIQMVSKMGWYTRPTAVAIRVLHPHAFLRRNRMLRDKSERRMALDVLAWSGLGTVGFAGLHAGMRVASGRLFRADSVQVDAFGPWADAVWESARGDYHALAVRTAEAMNTLLPPGERQAEWSDVIRLRVDRAERTVGWVVLTCSRLRDDPRFGDLVVGCLVDYFARPDDAPYVVAAGLRALRKRGADVAFANQSDARWLRAFKQNGFLLVENKRLVAASPALKVELESAPEGEQIFLTNMDGHGPQGL